MDLADKIAELKTRIERQKTSVMTEEATKTAFVLPFLQSLGYDIFNPMEVVPEFTADHGVKKGEKVDYAILQDGQMTILIECKPIGANLEAKHAGQLYRYFSVTDARFAVLTDGIRYVFYTDLEKENRMDERPFFEFHVLEYRDRDVDELKKFARQTFDLQNILDTAANLKYHNALVTEIASEFESPSEDLVKLLTSRIYSGRFTTQVKSQFEVLVSRALKDFVRERINERLKSALDNGSGAPVAFEAEPVGGGAEEASQVSNDGVVTTEKELDAFRTIQAIGSESVDPARIVMRDAKSYCAILLDDNNRKPICRFYFGKKRMAVGVFLPEGEERHEIESVVDIYRFRSWVLGAVGQYLGGGVVSMDVEGSVLINTSDSGVAVHA